MRKILILTGRYLPGFKDGGPLRTIVNITETLGTEYAFYIAAYDRDHGDTEPYTEIKHGEWNRVGKALVYYIEPGGFTKERILWLSEGMDLIYLTSFYESFGYRTLALRKEGKLGMPVVLASMGVFSNAALGKKAFKKKVFIAMTGMLGYYTDLTWSVTSELEAEDLKKSMGEKVKYLVAEDLPRSIVPGRREEIKKPLRFVFLSRICEHKGPGIIGKAFTYMKNKEISVDFYGPIEEKDYWSDCEKCFIEAGLHYRYLGEVNSEEVQSVLSGYDVFILPTKSENFGHVIFEALSVGLIPVIGENTPWDVEGAGFEIKPEPPALAKCLDNIIELSDAQLSELSKNSVQLAQSKVEEAIKNTGYRKIFQ